MNSHSGTRRIVLSSPSEEKPVSGEYSVPSPLKEDGLYAVEISESEMYDLGNIKFIPHFILYDRKNRAAIDITSDIKPAPLLSSTRPAEVLSIEGVRTIEQFLTGEIRPEYTTYAPQGIKYFKASEVTGQIDSLRERISTLKGARCALDVATENFRNEAVSIGKKYFANTESEKDC